MITGKEFIELGYRTSKWFKEAIEYANQHNLRGEALASYIKTKTWKSGFSKQIL